MKIEDKKSSLAKYQQTKFCEKNSVLCSSGFYPRHTRLVQHPKINQCNSFQQTDQEKSYDYLNRCKRTFDRAQHPFQ